MDKLCISAEWATDNRDPENPQLTSSVKLAYPFMNYEDTTHQTLEEIEGPINQFISELVVDKTTGDQIEADGVQVLWRDSDDEVNLLSEGAGRPEDLYTGQEIIALRQYYLDLGFSQQWVGQYINNSATRRENSESLAAGMRGE